MKTKIKIVSGGQTGVDRAALDAALDANLPCGGWCPQGRLAENGVIPLHYPLRELPGAGYRQRTLRNVIDSDATLIIYFSDLNGGTLLTRDFCRQQGKPHLLLDADRLSEEDAARLIDAFVRREHIEILNIAGPRASKTPNAYAQTLSILKRWMTNGGETVPCELNL